MFVHVVVVFKHSLKLGLGVAEISLGLEAVGKDGPLVVDASCKALCLNLTLVVLLQIDQRLDL